MRFLLPSLFLLLTVSANAQQLKGVVVDAASGEPLQKVLIENRNSGFVTTSGPSGTYAIGMHKGDVLRFSLLGYTVKELVIFSEVEEQYERIPLDKKEMLIDTVVIRPDLSPYQKDSLARGIIFGKKARQPTARFGLNKQGPQGGFGVLLNNPISAPYQRLSPKYKRLRAFQKRYRENEKQLFIDSRYTPALVQELTGLQGDTVAYFMNQYPMDYDYARAASDLELMLWIKHNYREWLQKPPARKEE